MSAHVGRSQEEIREAVRERYAAVARTSTSCCGGSTHDPRKTSKSIGYEGEALDSVPEDANLGLGCGNPTALASLKPGEVVLDLGSGGGLDALLASSEVGAEGHVIGVDMTREMLGRARRNAVEMGVESFVEFREGLIEALPVASASVNVIISNCVINLSPDKSAVFAEAFRVLEPGGRLAISDILLSEALPADISQLADVYAACVGGALVADDYLGKLRAAGFDKLEFTRSSAASLLAAAATDPIAVPAVEAVGAERLESVAKTLFSYKITAWKPTSATN
jgi:ubiquinone/menaquinone biosynthesis C-methylase UbiE